MCQVTQQACAPSTWTLTVLSLSVLGQLAWLAAIQKMSAAGCTSATPAAMPGSDGGEEGAFTRVTAEERPP